MSQRGWQACFNFLSENYFHSTCFCNNSFCSSYVQAFTQVYRPIIILYQARHLCLSCRINMESLPIQIICISLFFVIYCYPHFDYALVYQST
jgi:hypothetical protein